MKISILTISILLVALQTFGQTDAKDAKIDSLTIQNKSLVLQLDSVSGELTRYTGIYSVLYEKVFHYRFMPEQISFLIDSLRTSRDSASVFTVGTKSMASDSVLMLLNDNKVLMATIDSVKLACEKEKSLNPANDIVKAKVLNDLKVLKELLDNKIITDAEFLALKKKYLLKL